MPPLNQQPPRPASLDGVCAPHPLRGREQEISLCMDTLRAQFEFPRSHGMIEEMLRHLWDAFDGFDNLRDKRILDLGCGSRFSMESRFNDATFDRGIFHPWLCRAATLFGAQVTGVDIRSNRGEDFISLQLDLRVKDTLKSLPNSSFDGIHLSHLLSSPDLVTVQKASREERAGLAAHLAQECQRLLAPKGKIIHFDSNLDDW